VLFWVALAVVLGDRLSKFIVRTRLPLGESIPVIPGVFYLTHVENPGAAFSLLTNRRPLLVIIAIVVVAGIIVVSRQRVARDPLLRTALGLILGGAVGNLWDRAARGVVTDFLDVRVWPVFNLADSAIVVGAILAVWWAFRWPVDAGKTAADGRRKP